MEKRILLVEDDASFREVFARALSMAPRSAGTVGVCPSIPAELIESTNALALPGSSAMSTSGVA